MAERTIRGTNRTDRILAAMATRRNRQALIFLRESTPDRQPLAAIADHVAERGASDNRDRHAVAVSLHHTGLPMLADAGVITYDPDDRIARYLGHPMVDRFLDLVEERDEVLNR